MTSNNLYSYAKLSKYDVGMLRIFGPGLGNLLFPWARFVISTKKYGMKPIWPTWPQVKIGPFCRLETDKRIYNGLFSCPSNYISGWKKFFFLLFYSHISENNFEYILFNSDQNAERKVVIFSGMRDYFTKIKKDYETVKEELLKITPTKNKNGLNHDFRSSITVHVRLGDFRKSLIKGEVQTTTNVRLPLDWYIYIIEQLRNFFGFLVPVYIFSDGRDIELQEILALKNIQRLSFGSAIADLLGMSQSSVLIASGSTFSMWASYLGRMPVIWYRGQLRQKLYLDKPEAEVECAYGESLHCNFLNLLKKEFAHYDRWFS